MTSANTKNGFINWEALEHFIKTSLQLDDEKMIVEQFSEGYSNLTFLVKIGEWEGVLRRPPYGEVPKKAHDMKREYTILEKLHPHFQLAPKALLFSEGDDMMEKHFYIMEKKQGIVVDDKIPFIEGVQSIEKEISQSLIDTLVSLQQVDYLQAGLDTIGRPEGFLERQVTGWIKRYELSATDHIPAIKEVENWLIKYMPTTTETTIIHNDFKLNNVILAADAPVRVTGVLDWELATIGDPLSDFGSAVAYWGQKEDPDLGIHVVTNQPGFYSRRELVEAYATASKRDVSNMHYYLSFGFYKLAVILQQIYYRWRNGSLKDDRFTHLNTAVANLIEMAYLAKERQVL
ncbi:phosphotransferase family protein [Lysinibacillus sp. LZ02]|uniref:phosphotransferase family protein n=1 Tax=Lysinibacillus sp. LZ02 TaxID=3420668 RepID=UPI003D36A403